MASKGKKKVAAPEGVKVRYLSGGAWKARKLVKGARASRTSGREKGMVPTAETRTICRRNRSWKMGAAYTLWNNKYTGNKVRI